MLILDRVPVNSGDESYVRQRMAEHPFDQWLVDGDPTFGVMPGGLLSTCPREAPIYLFRGTATWGWMHIDHRHRTNPLFHFAPSIEAMVWDRCGCKGLIHASRDPAGLTVSIVLPPLAFLVLRYLPDFEAFSITTMFNRRARGSPDPVIGEYVPPSRPSRRPVFAWLPYR